MLNKASKKVAFNKFEEKKKYKKIKAKKEPNVIRFEVRN